MWSIFSDGEAGDSGATWSGATCAPCFVQFRSPCRSARRHHAVHRERCGARDPRCDHIGAVAMWDHYEPGVVDRCGGECDDHADLRSNGVSGTGDHPGRRNCAPSGGPETRVCGGTRRNRDFVGSAEPGTIAHVGVASDDLERRHGLGEPDGHPTVQRGFRADVHFSWNWRRGGARVGGVGFGGRVRAHDGRNTHKPRTNQRRSNC